MGSIVNKFFMLWLTTIIIAGCNDKASLQDILDHPALLKKEMARCQSSVSRLSSAEQQWCQVVLAAGSRFMGMVADRETDPEKFGVRIITAEENYAAAKNQLVIQQQKVTELQTKQASATELQKAQDQLVLAQKNYREKQQEVKLLLAVIGTSAPN